MCPVPECNKITYVVHPVDLALGGRIKFGELESSLACHLTDEHTGTTSVYDDPRSIQKKQKTEYKCSLPHRYKTGNSRKITSLTSFKQHLMRQDHTGRRYYCHFSCGFASIEENKRMDHERLICPNNFAAEKETPDGDPLARQRYESVDSWDYIVLFNEETPTFAVTTVKR